jgi:hypothetical protein
MRQTLGRAHHGRSKNAYDLMLLFPPDILFLPVPVSRRTCFDGRRQAVFCINCGVQLPSDARFCTSCGTAVKPANVAQPTAAKASSPSQLPRYEFLRVAHGSMEKAKGVASWIPVFAEMSIKSYIYIHPANKVGFEWFQRLTAQIEVVQGKVGNVDGPPEGATIWFNDWNEYKRLASGFEQYLFQEGWEPHMSEGTITDYRRPTSN